MADGALVAVDMFSGNFPFVLGEFPRKGIGKRRTLSESAYPTYYHDDLLWGILKVFREFLQLTSSLYQNWSFTVNQF